MAIDDRSFCTSQQEIVKELLQKKKSGKNEIEDGITCNVSRPSGPPDRTGLMTLVLNHLKSVTAPMKLNKLNRSAKLFWIGVPVKQNRRRPFNRIEAWYDLLE